MIKVTEVTQCVQSPINKADIGKKVVPMMTQAWNLAELFYRIFEMIRSKWTWNYIWRPFFKMAANDMTFYRKSPVNIINLMMRASNLVQFFFEIINSIMFNFSEWNYKMAAIFQDDHQWYDLQYKKSYKLHPTFDDTNI